MAVMFGFRIVNQYEKGLVFRFGKALPGTREPGLTWINPFTSRLRKVNMQIVTAAVPFAFGTVVGEAAGPITAFQLGSTAPGSDCWSS